MVDCPIGACVAVQVRTVLQKLMKMQVKQLERDKAEYGNPNRCMTMEAMQSNAMRMARNGRDVEANWQMFAFGGR